MKNLLEIEDLAIRLDTKNGPIHAVNGISYSVKKGETLGIVGESGSGKSVHTQAILGLLNSETSQVTGRILFDGQDLLELSQNAFRQLRGSEIGIVFQDPMSTLNPVMSVGAQICEALMQNNRLTRKQARSQAIEIFDAVQIANPKERLRCYPHQLSGGLRQRVGIALGICCHPKLLIADEPTTALDVATQNAILETLKDLRRQLDMSMILITHDLGVVSKTADRTAVMYGGQILEYGPTRAVFEDTRNAYTLGLLRSQPVPRSGTQKRRLTQISGAPPSLETPPLGDPFEPRNPFSVDRDRLERPPLIPVQNGHPDHKVAAWYDLPRAFQGQIEREGRALHPSDERQAYFPAPFLRKQTT